MAEASCRRNDQSLIRDPVATWWLTISHVRFGTRTFFKGSLQNELEHMTLGHTRLRFPFGWALWKANLSVLRLISRCLTLINLQWRSVQIELISCRSNSSIVHLNLANCLDYSEISTHNARNNLFLSLSRFRFAISDLFFESINVISLVSLSFVLRISRNLRENSLPLLETVRLNQERNRVLK